MIQFPVNTTNEERIIDWYKIAEGFKPIWIKLEDFIVEQESNEDKIGSHSGCFSNKRDLEIAKYFKSIKGQQ